MSRRYSQARALRYDADVEVTFFEDAGIPIWYATRMPDPWGSYLWHQWSHAWAEVTLKVTGNVWRNEGAKLYGVHRNADLRDDLESWLTVKAVEAGARFTPDPWHPQPHLQYAAFLYRDLRQKARWHFAEVVGDPRTGPGQAARDAYSRGIDSTDQFMEAAAEGVRPPALHVLHAQPFETADPVHVLIRLEDLLAQVEEVERSSLPTGVAYQSATSFTCLINLCGRPVYARGLCPSHYNVERKAAVERGDWTPRQPTTGCKAPGCEEPHEAKGYCHSHRRRLRETGQLEPIYQSREGHCEAEGCDRPIRARRLCRRHYG